METLSVNFGRKHFRADSIEDLLIKESNVQAGDRVVVTVSSTDLQDLRRRHQDSGLLGESEFDAAIARLRKAGAAVEIREVKAIPSRAIGAGAFDQDKRQLEELTPAVTLASYFEEEVNRSSMTNATASELLKAGMELLEEMEASNETPTSSMLTDIKLCSVSLEGFGPFKDRVTYPLLDRGLVLLRGTNKDGGSDSNGTGKSSLAMAALWGLTGSIDPRLVSDAKVADVVTDGCKTTKVVIQGMLNGEDFRITRTKTASKTGLVFVLGDKDLTTQSSRETQELIEETLGVSLQVLSRTVFHGQHLVNGLLEATDLKFKDDLAFIVPVDLWQRAATLARAKARDATKVVTELGGMTKLREHDLAALQVQRDEALERKEILRLALEEKRKSAQEQVDRLVRASVQYDIASIEMEIASLNSKITSLTKEVQECKQHRDEELECLTSVFDILSQRAVEARTLVQKAQRDLDVTSIKLEIAKGSLKSIEEKWQIDLSSESLPVLQIQKCPTCFQSISECDGDQVHGEIRKVFQDEVDIALVELSSAKEANESATNALSEARSILEVYESSLDKARNDVVYAKTEFNTKIANVEASLEDARAQHSHYSVQISDAFSNMKSNVECQGIKAALEAEEWSLRSAEERVNQLQQDCSRLEENLLGMMSQAETQRSVASTLSSLSDAFGMKGIQNYVQQNAIEALQLISQAYLDELSDGSLRLSLCLDAGDRIDRRAFVRLPDGDFAERPLSSLSGGQWRRCSLALTFGFLDLISRRGRLRPSLLVLDEPLTHLDRSGRSLVGSLLRKLLGGGEDIGGLGSSGICAGTIIMILQDLAAEELEEAFDHIDEVVKYDGFSSVSIDERSA
ncbi:calcineurin-like phosphoesterase-like protein [Fragilaria crotonensis]|nr:calcineurin-like phosphoesterase-like protein [Fragilaria crotonensis]